MTGSAKPAERDRDPVWNPVRILARLWERREVAMQLARREVELVYRGSLLGVFWLVLQPLILLGVYSLVFLGVFARPGGGAGQSEFVLGMFLGILFYSFFADAVTKAAQLILANPSYVKRVVFPLEVLPLSVVLAMLVNLGVGLLLLFVADLVFLGGIAWYALLLPVFLVPLALFTLGVSWFLSSLGVFLRDVPQIVRAGVLVLMFLTPIFWELEQVPASFHVWVYLNPLALVLLPAKDALIRGVAPDVGLVLGSWVVSLGTAILGHAWFAKTRDGFADVI